MPGAAARRVISPITLGAWEQRWGGVAVDLLDYCFSAGAAVGLLVDVGRQCIGYLPLIRKKC
jgi:hypothetical protein